MSCTFLQGINASLKHILCHMMSFLDVSRKQAKMAEKWNIADGTNHGQ